LVLRRKMMVDYLIEMRQVVDSWNGFVDMSEMVDY
jgi:hypothetical protein